MFAAPLMVSCTLMFLEVASPRFHSASVQFLYTYAHRRRALLLKTRTSIYEVSFPLEETIRNKVLIVFTFVLIAVLWSG